jgi:ATP-dependent Clp protease ATP-binding subunit ClpC
MPLEPLQNFTPRAQQVLALARREADRLHHDRVGTAHLLIGLIKLGQGPAVAVLLKMGLDLESVRKAVVIEAVPAPEAGVAGRAPFERAVKICLALAAKEALSLGHTYLGTEHMLLALLRGTDDHDPAANVLKSFGVDLERTRIEIISELS